MVSPQQPAYGVLFDVDGTLIDSNYQHTLAWWQAFRRLGHDVQMASIHRAIGMGSDKLIGHLLGDDRQEADDEVLSSTHGAVFSTFWPSLRAFQGARELLDRCAGAGLTVVLSSSAHEDELQVLRKALNADDAISHATSSADAEASKPSPDILAAALETAGLEAGNTLFVGDSVWDVKAAAELGISCLGVTCGGTSEAELLDAGAMKVYADPEDLLAHFDGSPLAELAGRRVA
jgi:phosphoglycolate phosphatase-like HAD superfamily hydrolase